HRGARSHAPRPGPLRAPAPHRRERLGRGRAAARVPARSPAPPSHRGRARPPRPKGRREDARRPGAPRLERVSRLGRFEPVPASPRRPAHALRRTPRRACARPIALHLATDGDAVALVTTARPLADAAPAAVAITPASPRTAEQRIEEQLA